MESTLSDRLNPTHPAFDADLKARWKTMPKKERQALVDADHASIAGRKAATAAIEHPFAADEDDHAETSPQAYADIAELLDILCARLGKDRPSVRIYDPYFWWVVLHQE